MILPDFDARTVAPQQPSGGGHPPGIWDFQITNSYLKASANNEHLMLVLELTSPAGRMEERYIVAGTSAKAIEIAQKQLSALCHAISIYHVAYPKNPDGSPIMEQGGHSLRGGRGKMEIAPQTKKGQDGKQEETGYMEIKKYFDAAGNEPGKSGAAPQPQAMQQTNAPQQQQQSAQGQPQPAWGNQQAPQQATNAPAPAWGNAGPGAAPVQQQPSAAPAWGQPQQGQQPNAAPAWANPGNK